MVRLRGGLLAACLLCTTPSSAQDATSFAEERLATHEALQRGAWARARERTLELLRRHAGAPYARPYLDELHRGLKLASFRAETELPDPGSLVSGDVLRYDPEQGELAVRYDAASLADFHSSADRFTHPVTFTGDWKATLEGPPGVLGNTILFVEWARADAVYLLFGFNLGDAVSRNHRILGGRIPKPLFQKEARKRNASKPVEGELRVRDDTLEMRYAGSRVERMDHEGDGFGSFGFMCAEGAPFHPDVTLTLEGEVDPRWIEERAERALAEAREAFDATWEAPEELAAWGKVVDDRSRRSLREVVADLSFAIAYSDGSSINLMRGLESTLAGGRPAHARALLRRVEDEGRGLPPDARAALRLRAYTILGNTTEALANFEELDPSAGQERPYGRAKARLLHAVGRTADACRVLDFLVADFPEDPGVHALKVEMLLETGDVEGARRAVEAGLEHRPESRTLRELERDVQRAAEGPPWLDVEESEGKHCLVRTSGSSSLAKETRDTFDRAWSRCEELFGPLPGDVPATTKVLVFEDRGAFESFTRSMTDDERASPGGGYSSRLGSLVLLQSRGMPEVLRHALALRYAELALGRLSPLWFREGLARELAFRFERDRSERVRRAKSALGNGFELQAFFDMNDATFRAEPRAAIGAWCLVHFMLEDTDRRRDLERIRDILRDGTDPGGAVGRVLNGAGLTRLERAFRSWLVQGS